jgi:hypothetical protein
MLHLDVAGIAASSFAITNTTAADRLPRRSLRTFLDWVCSRGLPARDSKGGCMKTIYVLVKNGEKTYFNRAGVAFTPNKDGSVNFKLDLFPGVSFQMRDKDDKESSSSAATQPPQ